MQGLRDLLANRKFAIPLIALLGLSLVGVLMIGFVLIFQPGRSSERVAEVEATDTPAVTDTPLATDTPLPTDTPTPRPTATFVPVGVPDAGEGETPAADAGATSEPSGTEVSSAAGTETVEPTDDATGQGDATAEATDTTEAAGQETTTPEPEEDELAQTGLGWGLVLFSAIGLGGLAIVARRLRLAS